MKKPGHKPHQNSRTTWFRKAFNLDLPHLGTACTVLMISTLNNRIANGHFLRIASKMPGIRFKLVLNEPIDDDVVRNHIGMLPANCSVFGAQHDLLPFYKEAHLVLNLSAPGEDSTISDRSILEAMACGRPVIVPDQDGKYDMVTDGREGFHIDPNNENKLLTAIRELCSDARIFYRFSVAARETALHFPLKQISQH
ncbi:glycosyltransferase [Pseudobacter ginsenosidimutans]|uniref:Glycosyl transferase family 1 n=1 Tax=Pseudobacter ginsenosidimutans TaxID=661488 RepID=A0A4Q7N101_9BACT|nr:glycosyltransferase [Pseudobacter ginsenosidimutans]QEC43604.1 glycosyltransferase family 4 protein [Pseudobacter ginsenosidimutans]RZS75003.1 glycosyl transferase family 1 [Pseudobacter ginsenosidimutans]